MAMPEDKTDILVEDFIPGVEVALEGLLADGQLRTLALFDKPDPLDGPFFEETIYVTPSRLSAETQAAISASVSLAAASIGLRDGPVHAELRVNEQGPWMLEIAGRSIGGLCSTVLEFGAGMRLEEILLRHALGMETPALERTGAAAGVMMIPDPARRNPACGRGCRAGLRHAVCDGGGDHGAAALADHTAAGGRKLSGFHFRPRGRPSDGRGRATRRAR